MDIWQDAQTRMANNLVKWWKTKFLNGYRQFSVECGDGKVSDTEELLGRLGSEQGSDERLRPACTTPPPKPEGSTTSESATPKKQPQQLNFEEFSCDVSVEDNNDTKPGQERQEFSFTLYDFDGHGKITKDDIAGLVTTIYEALGSSVKVPHYGSKTIKVKLTVSPDQRKHVSATIINDKPQENVRYKRDLNVTIRQEGDKQRTCREKRSTRRRHHCCGKKDEEEQENPLVSDDSSDGYSRLSGASSEEEEDEEGKSGRKAKTEKCNRSTSPRYTIPNLFIKETTCGDSPCKKSPKKRSGSLQRQELLEIIQANMEKNNLGFQTPRKHSNHVSTQTRQSEPHKHQPKSPKMAPSPLQYLANIVDPTHFYVDLASLQNTTHLPQTHCQYDKLIDAVMCVSNKKGKPKCRRHQRTKTEEAQPPAERPQRRRVNVVTGHTSSPHHLRHRNRQEDQARAMAQVVRWLEQEFSSKEKSRGFAYKEKGAAPGVARHEHHHVHEHIHHHYHHYQEPPLVV